MIQLPSISTGRWKYLLILALSIAVVYGQSARFHFIHYDDDELVYRNETYLSDWTNVFTSFTTHAFVGGGGESVYYRPILLVTFIAEYHLWGLTPAAYHLDNVLLHLIAATLVFLLAELLTRDRLAALFSSLIFALHPVQTEAVGWVAGRNDILLGIFVILMMIFYHRFRTHSDGATASLLLSVICFAFALFTKESAAFYLLLIPAFDLCFGDLSTKDLFSKPKLRGYSGYLIVLALYLLIRLKIFGAVIGAEKLYGHTSLGVRLLTAPAILAEHLRLLILPSGLSVAHPVEDLIWRHGAWQAAALALVLLLPAGIVWSRRHSPGVRLGLLWLAVGFLPLADLVPVAIPILEHRLYVPMAGLALAVGAAVFELQSLQRRRAASLLGSLVIVLAAITFVRLPVWQSGTSLFRDAVMKSPGDLRSLFSLAQAHYEEGDYEKAIHRLRDYLARDSNDVRPYILMREVYYVEKQNLRVAEICRKLIDLEPRNPVRYLETGAIYEEMNRPDTAAEFYLRGLELDSTRAEIHLRLGVVEARMGRIDEAERQLRSALALESSNEEEYLELARVYVSTGRFAEATALLERGFSRLPHSRDIAGGLRDLYLKTGRNREAAAIEQQFKF